MRIHLLGTSSQETGHGRPGIVQNSIQDATLATTKLSKIVRSKPQRCLAAEHFILSVDRGRIQRLVEAGPWPLVLADPRRIRLLPLGLRVVPETGNLTRIQNRVKGTKAILFLLFAALFPQGTFQFPATSGQCFHPGCPVPFGTCATGTPDWQD